MNQKQSKYSEQIEEVTRRIPGFLVPLQEAIDAGEDPIGQQVIYIPTHMTQLWKQPMAWGYPIGIEPGFPISWNHNGNALFVRYWLWDGKTGTFKRELRTKANSELTYLNNLYFFDFFPKDIEATIQKLMEDIRNEQK